MDEPRYWSFDNLASRTASHLPLFVRGGLEEEPEGGRTPRPLPPAGAATTVRGRSESGYGSYGSRWDWEAGEEEKVGEGEGEKRKWILRIWSGWVRERRERGRAAGRLVRE